MDEPAETKADGPNADQVAFWNSPAGERWAANQERIDAQFVELTADAVAFAEVPVGARVLDIGCGAGATVLALAEAVGPRGHVTGIDISRPMLDVAERRVRQAGLGHVTLELQDAAVRAFAPDSFDAAFSRFGVMFFDDPAGAFANIRRGLRPGARLAFVCWRRMADNPFFLVPWLALKPFVPEQPPPVPHAPGPFGFADPDHVRGVLTGAGFTDVELRRHDLLMPGRDPATALDLATKVGPAARPLAELDEATRVQAAAALEQALVPYVQDGQVRLGASLWLVAARA